jgi:hypothetical protein
MDTSLPGHHAPKPVSKKTVEQRNLALPDPRIGGYHLHVVNGQAIIDQALRRIRQAGAKYHLQPQTVTKLCARFTQAATAELQPAL